MSGNNKSSNGIHKTQQDFPVTQREGAGKIENGIEAKAASFMTGEGEATNPRKSSTQIAMGKIIRPVLIVDVVAHDPTETNSNRLVLKKDELEKILSKVGTTPVAIVSIAGPTRLGKSFILNFMIKYLQHARGCTTDWIRSGSTQNDTNGFKWSCGSSRETVGIWMWPEPFFRTTEEGKEVAVLLVDTQGVFDQDTDQKDWGNIVGLSLLTSSCLIFNIPNSLKEDILLSLKQYMDFSKIASGPNENTKSYQKLVFLIRDWQFSEEQEFGDKGGSTYLSSILNTRKTESGRLIREQIQNCFDHLSCYLMPHPGQKVFKKVFEGAITDMDTEFVEHVKKFIPWLFRCSHFGPKFTSGCTVTGESLLFHYEEYVKIFNSDKMPTSKELNQAQAAIQNQGIIRECIAIYKQKLQSIRKTYSRGFLIKNEKHKAHAEADACALRHWNEARKMGSDEHVREFETILDDQIRSILASLSAQNKNIRFDAVHNAISDAKKQFTKLMNAEVRKRQQGNDNFVLPAVFNKIYKDCKSRTQDELLKHLQLESTSNLNQKETDNFNTVISSVMSYIENNNLRRQHNGDQEMKKLVSNLATAYKRGIQNEMAKFKYWTSECVQTLHTQMCNRLANQFESEHGKSSLFLDGQEILRKEFTVQLNDANGNAKIRNDLYIKDCEQHVTSLVKAFSDSIEQKIMGATSGTTDLLQEYIGRFKIKLEHFKDFDRLPPTTASCFLSDLSSRITASYNTALRKAYPIKRKELLKQSKTRMHDISSSEVVQNGKSLMQVLEKEKKNVLAEFSTMFKDLQFVSGSMQEQTAALKKIQDFRDEVDKCITEIMDRNVLKRKALLDNIKGEYSKAVSSYTKKIDEINSKLYNSDTYLELSKVAMDLTIEKFEKACKENSSYGDSTESLQNLRIHMDRLARFTRSEDDIIEIHGPSLNFSTELNKLEKASCIELIQQVNWIATEEIILDEDICGETWSGKNVVLCAPQIHVGGIERVIDVSGKKGKFAQTGVLPVPRERGACGCNGKHGDSGESGGNVAIFAHSIRNAKNLYITSNGGTGGDGQHGGAGSDGNDGINGDDRLTMSLDDLLIKFPSPAMFHMAQRTENFDEGTKSLTEFAKGKDIILKEPLETESSKYWELTTPEGAVIHYAFYEGLLKGRIGMRSFFIWFQGAPGTNGQPGGAGGHGGSGGRPGHSGSIYCPVSYKDEIFVANQEIVTSGSNGGAGASGKDGTDGKQGTDYAYLDPYAGWSPISSKYQIQKFSGNLNIRLGRKADDGTWEPFESFAYCPYRQRYIRFVDSNNVKNVEIVNHAQQQVEKIAVAEPIMKKPIDIEYFNDLLERTRPAE